MDRGYGGRSTGGAEESRAISESVVATLLGHSVPPSVAILAISPAHYTTIHCTGGATGGSFSFVSSSLSLKCSSHRITIKKQEGRYLCVCCVFFCTRTRNSVLCCRDLRHA